MCNLSALILLSKGSSLVKDYREAINNFAPVIVIIYAHSIQSINKAHIFNVYNNKLLNNITDS